MTKNGFGVVVFLLIALIVMVGIGRVLDVRSMYNGCDEKTCRLRCSAIGGKHSRVLNMGTHHQDGWIDCFCLGATNSHIPIMPEESKCDD